MVTRTLALFPELEQDIATFRTGILPYQHLKRLAESNQIASEVPFDEPQFQPASLDLRLGPVAYQVRASFLPGRTATVLSMAGDLLIQELNLAEPVVLQKGGVYIVPLMEHLRLPPDILGKANPKSTVGRLDVFARLITDYGERFETVPAGYKGKLYLEVAPRSFSIRVHAGTKLSQLRLMRGTPNPSDAHLNELQERQGLVYTEDGEPARATISNGLWLSLDLVGSTAEGIIGFRAIPNAPVIDLDREDHYDPVEYWEPIRRPPGAQLILAPGDFYILGSRERVSVPPESAAEMVPYDPSVGEFRVHYAGFFDPGFGSGPQSTPGTRAILEVRSHEVPYLMREGQRIGRLVYERLLELPHKVYGSGAGSAYQSQSLGLAKQFKRPRGA